MPAVVRQQWVANLPTAIAAANANYSQPQPVGSTFVLPAPVEVPQTWEPLPEAVSSCLGRPTLPPPHAPFGGAARNLQLDAGEGTWGVGFQAQQGARMETLESVPRAPGEEARPLMAPGPEATPDYATRFLGQASSCCGSPLALCCCGCCLVVMALVALATAALVTACRADYIEPNSQALSVIHRLGDDGSVGWWSLKLQPMSQLHQVQSSLYKQETRMLAGMNMSFGTALGHTAAHLMYNSTRVDGVWERVPAKFHGVFWVRSPLLGEALTTFQYSRWFDDEQLLVVPRSPMTWAWRDGKAVVGDDGEQQGFMYDAAEARERSVESILQTPTLSFKFSSCPEGAKYCAQGGGDALAFATVQAHPSGSLQAAENPGALIDATLLESAPALQGLVKGTFALEELPGGKQPGSLWRQTSFWGIGSCECAEMGSFSLTKILDGNGEPLEPYYGAFAESVAAQTPFYLWTGWPTAADRGAAARRFAARAAIS